LSVRKSERETNSAEKKTDSASDFRSTFYCLSIVSQLGFTIATCVLGGVVVGAWLGEKAHNRTAGVLLGVLAGLATGFWSAYKLLKKVL